MSDNHTNFSLYGKSPLYQLFVSMLIILEIGIFLFSLSLLAGIQIFDSNFGVIENPSTATSQKDIMFLRYVMISQDIALFVIPALIILTLIKPGGKVHLADLRLPQINDLGLVFGYLFLWGGTLWLPVFVLCNSGFFKFVFSVKIN